MALKRLVVPEMPLIVHVLSGFLTVDQVLDTLRKVPASRDEHPEADWLVFLPPDARLAAADANGLKKIQNILLAGERRGAFRLPRRLALVSPDPVVHPTLKLYRALWTTRRFPSMEMETFTILKSAAEWLGVPADALIIEEIHKEPAGSIKSIPISKQ